MIIGITGYFATGKDEAAHILEDMGFIHISLSDAIREEILSRGQEVTRDELFRTANEMREKHGPSYWAERALKKAENPDKKNYVFSSIRNPKEAALLAEHPHFTLVEVQASDEIRLKRIVSRDRENDPKTLDELRAKEAQESSNTEHMQQLPAVKALATESITNNGTLEELKEKVKGLVQKLQE